MSVTVDMSVVGLYELDKALADLTDRLASKALNGAISYAATPMIKDAKARAAKAEADHLMKYGNRYELVHPGLLKEAIRRRKLKKGELAAIGASAGYALYIGKGKTQKLYPRYWHFIEFGTSKMSAAPYFRPAFELNKELFIQRFSQKLAQNIEKYTPIPLESDNL